MPPPLLLKICCLPSSVHLALLGACVPSDLLDLVVSYAGTLELPLMLLPEFLGKYFLARRAIGRTSQGSLRCFAFLSTLDSHTLIHVNDIFCLCMMHHYVLYEQRRLLQWLSPFFSVFQSFLLLIASPIALRHNGTPRACFG
jgi:hypothetical protein